ncbi:DUF4214 domain-containing protein [Serratia rubidaea]|uniref:DUF4214 domain-containing protein n=1 Tax=Serratia rubidaea TaxID=61652 RepID=UPI002432BFC3|nr:DUF4214 domain-containing protein [Serratia rubidaea]MCR0998347.1 DUF4214 domain-containing protein [Serratia rubidaea]
MSILTLQQDVALLYYAALGKHADESALFYFAKQLSNGHYNTSQLVSALINSADGAKRYDGLSTEQKVQYIYQNITGEQPDSATLDSLVKQQLAGKTLGTLTNQIIDSVKSADGEHTHQQHIQEVVNNTLYPSSLVEDGQIAAASDVQGIYYLLGSMTNARAIDYWGNQLASGQKSAIEIANLFVAERSYINQLSNEAFVKTLYANAFGTAISDGDLQKYLGGLDDGTQTHGDVIMQMMADIRNDTDHDAAKENFAAATHVYAPGEMPDAKYVETVMSLYLAVAGSGTNATALDTFSRLLASGTSNQDLLKTLANSQQFSGAGDYQKIYSTLYGSEMSSSVSQALMLKTGNDKIAASSLIIDAFRNGEYPLGGTHWSIDQQLRDFNQQLADIFGYQKSFNGTFTLSDDGKLMAETNSYGNHALSNIELVALSGMTSLSINADKDLAITLDKALKNAAHIVLTGKYAASEAVSKSFGGRHVELHLDDAALAHADASNTLYYSKVLVQNGTDLTQANINLSAGSLLWQGNSVDGGANHVSKTFIAKGGSDSSISANFITKSVYLTTDENGELHGQIVSNLDQYQRFSTIDLTHYVGTGEIYLDGKLVATEGRNVFDFGLFEKNATIFHPDYANTASLEQDPNTNTDHWSGFIYDGGGMLSAYSGDLTLLNVRNHFYIDGELTKDSHVSIHTSARPDDTSFSLSFTEKASLIPVFDMGSFSFNSDHLQTLSVNMGGNETTAQTRTLKLDSGDNSISELMLSGWTTSLLKPLYLNLTVGAGFSDNLQTIKGNDYYDRDYFSNVRLNLNAEMGGTGGGSFYTTLNGLANKEQFAGIIDDLAGYQLSVQDTGLTIMDAHVQGNTTISSAKNLSFEHSSIDNLVTFTGFISTNIKVGDSANPWIFSPTGDKTATLYGSATTDSELKAVFSGLNASNNAQDLFAQVLDKMSNGASKSNLAEVSMVKLDKAVYVIVDNNHNQSFDADDIVFSLGDRDPYLSAVSLHYQAPTIEANGVATASHTGEVIAA